MGRFPLRTRIRRYIEDNGDLAEATLKERKRKLEAFARRYEEMCRRDSRLKKDPAHWGEKEILAILADNRSQSWSVATHAKCVENIQALLKSIGNGIIDKMMGSKSHMFPRRIAKRGPRLNEEQVAKVIQASNRLEGWTGEIARFLVAFSVYEGPRPIELRRAEIDDLDTTTWTFTVRHPKGEGRYGERRKVPIPTLIRPIVTRYLEQRRTMLEKQGIKEARPLICSERHPNTSYSDVCLRRIKSLVEVESGIRFDLRTLRRTYGQMLLDRHKPYEIVAKAMGHGSVLTTQRYYCDIDEEVMRQEVLQAFEETTHAPTVNSPLIDKKDDFTGYA